MKNKKKIDKLYLIGGLGVDEKVFLDFKIDTPTQIIKWIKPTKNERLSSYALRLSDVINTDEKFSLLGVSFGGVVALELTRYVHPEKVFLVSSAQYRRHLPSHLLNLVSLGGLSIIPNFLFTLPNFVIRWHFNPINEKLFNSIIRDTSPSFVKWALKEMAEWKGVEFDHVVRIHGNKDRLIPIRGHSDVVIKGGSHFMIVDRSKEIAQIVTDHTS